MILMFYKPMVRRINRISEFPMKKIKKIKRPNLGLLGN